MNTCLAKLWKIRAIFGNYFIADMRARLYRGGGGNSNEPQGQHLPARHWRSDLAHPARPSRATYTPRFPALL